MDLRQTTLERYVRYLLQNAELLEKLHLPVEAGPSLVEVLFPPPCARTLKGP